MVHLQHITVSAVGRGLFIIMITIDVCRENHVARGAISDNWGKALHFAPLSSVACTSGTKRRRESSAGLKIVSFATARPMVHSQYSAVSTVGSGLLVVMIAVDVAAENHVARGTISDNWGKALHFAPLSSVACASGSD
jgi:hypothetical protein